MMQASRVVRQKRDRSDSEEELLNIDGHGRGDDQQSKRLRAMVCDDIGAAAPLSPHLHSHQTYVHMNTSSSNVSIPPPCFSGTTSLFRQNQHHSLAPQGHTLTAPGPLAAQDRIPSVSTSGGSLSLHVAHALNTAAEQWKALPRRASRRGSNTAASRASGEGDAAMQLGYFESNTTHACEPQYTKEEASWERNSEHTHVRQRNLSNMSVEDEVL
jgi:hypothetical protein